jgi:hypothetical protein
LRDDTTRKGRIRWSVVTASVAVLSVMLANVLARGFSWGDVGALAVLWAVATVVLFVFSGGILSDRRR